MDQKSSESCLFQYSVWIDTGIFSPFHVSELQDRNGGRHRDPGKFHTEMFGDHQVGGSRVVSRSAARSTSICAVACLFSVLARRSS